MVGLLIILVGPNQPWFINPVINISISLDNKLIGPLEISEEILTGRVVTSKGQIKRHSDDNY